MTRQEETKIIKQSNLIDYLQSHGHKKLWQSDDGKQASFKTPWQNSPSMPETFLSVFKGRNDNFWHYTERYGNEKHQVTGDTGTIIDLYCKLHGVVFGDAMQKLRQEILINPSRTQATDAMAKPLSTPSQQDGGRTMTIPVNVNLTATESRRDQAGRLISPTPSTDGVGQDERSILLSSRNTNQAETQGMMEKPNSTAGSSRLDPVAATRNLNHADPLWMEKTNHPDEIINYKKTLTVFSSQAEAERWQKEYENTATVMVAVNSNNYPEIVNHLDNINNVYLVFTGQGSTAMTHNLENLLVDIVHAEDMRDDYDRFTNKINTGMVDKIQNMTGADYDDIYELAKKINQHDKTPKQIDDELTNRVKKFLAKEQEQETKKFAMITEEPAAQRTARIFNRTR